MARGIYVKKNGTWGLGAPSVKVDGTYTPVKAAWTKKNGSWQQVWPPNVTAKILVVGGGGGGGIGYGMEGGGGGGAGGVLYRENIILSAISGTSYNVIVGAGGGANTSGQNSFFGQGTAPTPVPGVSTPVYAGTYPVYNWFLNTYGVWTSPDMVNPVGVWQYVTYYTSIPTSQNYTVRCSADNQIHVSINGGEVVSNYDWASFDDATVSIPAGTATITISALNLDGGSPGLFAAAIYAPGGSVIWSTRSTEPVAPATDWMLAIGGGNGGWGTPEQTAGSGGSGGGGCGYVNTHSGGNGTPGQGNPGGTGIWQGFGAAGGGGGGGYSGAGAQGDNRGGDGGSGISLLGVTVGGGGGGGYGDQASGANYGPGGSGGAGGGGAGNGGNGVDGTGGGGGGSLHRAATNAGNGGSGTVVVQYPANTPVFSGGAISNSNGLITHIFASPGSSALTV
ncbi:hypothetical protein UFOVP112_116 [uncultured Caudovirales phage]|uniref:Glycine-rich domain-containing protein n=1 Tax=uncultured Caudovirales phage TaxID=2100421 RepID=A0A6J5L362_9CAUD|nr:hypothetical protein UFOVP112_116 [uncultured Caudovirales phage]